MPSQIPLPQKNFVTNSNITNRIRPGREQSQIPRPKIATNPNNTEEYASGKEVSNPRPPLKKPVINPNSTKRIYNSTGQF